MEEQIIQAYVNSGKLRLEYRHFPVIGPESLLAAEASECAADQGRFWPYHTAIFADQPATPRGGLDRERLDGYAKRIGLDMAVFGTCLDEGRRRDTVIQQARQGQQLGVRATPAFILAGSDKPLATGQLIEGLAPFEDFQRYIEAALAGR